VTCHRRLHIAKAFGALVISVCTLVGRFSLECLGFTLSLFASADATKRRENDGLGPMFDDLQTTGKLNHRTGRYDDGSDVGGIYEEPDS
jgi:hypothetical protein